METRWFVGSEQLRAAVAPDTRVESVWLGARLVSRSAPGGGSGAVTVPIAGGKQATVTFHGAHAPVLRVDGAVVQPSVERTTSSRRALTWWLTASTGPPILIGVAQLRHGLGGLLWFGLAVLASVALTFVWRPSSLSTRRRMLLSLLVTLLSFACVPVLVAQASGRLANPFARLLEERRTAPCTLTPQKLYVRAPQAIFDLERLEAGPVCVNAKLRDRPAMAVDGQLFYAGQDGLHRVETSGYARGNGGWRAVDDESSPVRPLPPCDSQAGFTLIAPVAPGDDAMVFACDAYGREFHTTWLQGPIRGRFLAVSPHKDLLSSVEDKGQTRVFLRDVLGAAHDVIAIPNIDMFTLLAARTDAPEFLVAVASTHAQGTLYRVDVTGDAHELGRYPRLRAGTTIAIDANRDLVVFPQLTRLRLSGAASQAPTTGAPDSAESELFAGDARELGSFGKPLYSQ